MTARMLAWKQLFIQRVRNSSLVERSCVDDERASRPLPKLWDEKSSVGEHSSQPRRCGVSHAGAAGNENVGISNDNQCRNIDTENPRFPEQR